MLIINYLVKPKNLFLREITLDFSRIHHSSFVVFSVGYATKVAFTIICKGDFSRTHHGLSKFIYSASVGYATKVAFTITDANKFQRKFKKTEKINPMQKISAIVIAAGLSRRMGEDKNKLLLPLGKSNMIGTVLKNILSADFEELIVVLGYESQLVATAIPLHEKIKCVFNPDFEKGMTSSIQCGVEAANVENAIMICLSDMPFIKKEAYNFLIKNFQNNVFFDKKCIIQPFFEGKKGNPIVFSAHYRTEILAHQEPEGCRSIVQKNKDFIHLVEMSSDAVLRDIDDWEMYEKLIKHP